MPAPSNSGNGATSNLPADLAALRLAERVRVRPVAHVRRAAGLEVAPRLLLHVRRDAVGGGAVLDAVDHELERLEVLRRVDDRLGAVLVEDLAAGRVGDLEEVAGQALVRRALVDDAVVLGGRGIDLLPRGRHLVDLVGAVVQERRVGLLRHAPRLAVVVHRVERRRDQVALALLGVRRHVEDPLLRRELRRPDHVGVEDVALAGLRLLALDELRALLVGRGGELQHRGVHVGIRLVERLDRGGLVARGVLAEAERHIALGAVHRRRVDRLGAFGGTALLRGAVTTTAVLILAASGDKSPAGQVPCKAGTEVSWTRAPPLSEMGWSGTYPLAVLACLPASLPDTDLARSNGSARAAIAPGGG